MKNILKFVGNIASTAIATAVGIAIYENRDKASSIYNKAKTRAGEAWATVKSKVATDKQEEATGE